jgi:hypothetical protein
MTSIPGAVKGLATNPREAAQAIWKQTTAGGALGTGLAVGMPAVMAANDLRKGDESAVGGRTIGQKLVKHTIDTGTGFAFGGTPFLSQQLAGMGANALSNKLTAPKNPPATSHIDPSLR